MTVFGTEVLAAVCLFAALGLVVVALLPRRSKPDQPAFERWKGASSNQRSPREVTPVASSSKPSGNGVGTLDLSDVGVQLNAIMKAAFQKRRVMNRSEYEVFRIVESEVTSARMGHRTFAQTSLGEVLESPSSDAFRSINAKRVDILVVDGSGWPAFAVEVQGKGHYQGTAAARDAIKKEALRRAGVGYVEVVPSDSEQQLRNRIRELLGMKTVKPAAARKHPGKVTAAAQFH